MKEVDSHPKLWPIYLMCSCGSWINKKGSKNYHQMKRSCLLEQITSTTSLLYYLSQRFHLRILFYISFLEQYITSQAPFKNQLTWQLIGFKLFLGHSSCWKTKWFIIQTFPFDQLGNWKKRGSWKWTFKERISDP